MPPKPTLVPDWATTATGLANSTMPASGFRGDGWPNGYQPPSQYFNALMNLYGQWYDWLNDLQNEVLIWTAQNFFAAGIVVTQSTVNGSAVTGTGNGVGAGIYGVSGDTNGATGVEGFVGPGATNGQGGKFTGKGTGAGAINQGGTAGGAGSTNTAGVGSNAVGSVNQGDGTAEGAQNIGGAGGAGSTNTAGVGSNTVGSLNQGDGNGAGALCVGGATGPGAQFTAGGGSTPARGSARFSVQATPTAPLNGDAWVDNSAGTPRAGLADFNGNTRYFVGHQNPTGFTYANSWTDRAAAPGKFYTNGQGRCHLKGSIRNAGTPTFPSTVVTGLPIPSSLVSAGYLQFPVSVNGGKGLFLRVDNSGNAVLYDPDTNWASGNSVDLEHISYDVQ